MGEGRAYQVMDSHCRASLKGAKTMAKCLYCNEETACHLHIEAAELRRMLDRLAQLYAKTSDCDLDIIERVEDVLWHARGGKGQEWKS